ncbi:MAG: flagellar protein FliS [Planctomycetaceae bacterium]|nr:flagellar protein FliS [Planctomycetaceae bacterium]
MNPQKLYRRHASHNWTRADMLLAIYDEAERSLETADQLLVEGDLIGLIQAQLRCVRLILLLLEGIDPDQGEVAHNIHRLCVYVIDVLATDSPDRFQKALDVIRPLKAGFTSARAEANELEANGHIPRLNFDSGANVAFA